MRIFRAMRVVSLTRDSWKSSMARVLSLPCEDTCSTPKRRVASRALPGSAGRRGDIRPAEASSLAAERIAASAGTRGRASWRRTAARRISGARVRRSCSDRSASLTRARGAPAKTGTAPTRGKPRRRPRMTSERFGNSMRSRTSASKATWMPDGLAAVRTLRTWGGASASSARVRGRSSSARAHEGGQARRSNVRGVRLQRFGQGNSLRPRARRKESASRGVCQGQIERVGHGAEVPGGRTGVV